MKTKLLPITGIFLMIFGIDGFLLLDSSVPECKGFTGMTLFVFVTLGFDSRVILSNLDCLESFAGQIIGGAIFLLGLGMILHKIIKIQNNYQKLKNLSLKK